MEIDGGVGIKDGGDGGMVANDRWQRWTYVRYERGLGDRRIAEMEGWKRWKDGGDGGDGSENNVGNAQDGGNCVERSHDGHSGYRRGTATTNVDDGKQLYENEVDRFGRACLFGCRHFWKEKTPDRLDGAATVTRSYCSRYFVLPRGVNEADTQLKLPHLGWTYAGTCGEFDYNVDSRNKSGIT